MQWLRTIKKWCICDSLDSIILQSREVNARKTPTSIVNLFKCPCGQSYIGRTSRTPKIRFDKYIIKHHNSWDKNMKIKKKWGFKNVWDGNSFITLEIRKHYYIAFPEGDWVYCCTMSETIWFMFVSCVSTEKPKTMQVILDMCMPIFFICVNDIY